MDITFKIKGKANQYYINDVPSVRELEDKIEKVLLDDLGIIASIEVTDFDVN